MISGFFVIRRTEHPLARLIFSYSIPPPPALLSLSPPLLLGVRRYCAASLVFYLSSDFAPECLGQFASRREFPPHRASIS